MLNELKFHWLRLGLNKTWKYFVPLVLVTIAYILYKIILWI